MPFARLTLVALPLMTMSLTLSLPARAVPVALETGQTSVLLDTDLLQSAASLTLSSVSSDVIVPGNLGAGSVAFSVNSRDASPPSLPTTFAYDSDDFLGTFSGTIEHSGSVFFNADTVEVGDFTIGFDAARVSAVTSGFYVESTVGLPGILFDVGIPSTLVPTAASLTIAADLLVSNEFASFLLSNNLSSGDLTGADVGDALVEARVPSPVTLALLLAGLVAFGYQRRKSAAAS